MRPLALASVLLVTACGGSDSPTPTSQVDAATASSDAAVSTDASTADDAGNPSSDDAAPSPAHDMGTPTTATAPPGATSAGYSSQVFEDEFTNLDTIDLKNTKAAGFNWYVAGDFFPATPGPTAKLATVKIGTVTALSIDGSSRNALLGQINDSGKVLGRSFSAGAYFEARIAMSVPKNGSSDWPAFWGLPNLDGNSEHWEGNPDPDYTNSIELDMMEFMPESVTGHTFMAVHSSVHDWYSKVIGGKSKPNVTSSYTVDDTSKLTIESTTANPVFHTIGTAWVPSVNGAEGYIQFYWDDVPFGSKITWVGTPPTTEATTNDWTPTSDATKTPWTFGAMDVFPQSLIVSNGGGAFMYVDWVRVWQK